ncbi:MAG TPA: polyprenyl synthetase family protein [Candidatus Saccharimonadales bacterium]|nr:polyprenyl synthetase family protein [Candidatus Saccharimonadales bacterium]
MPATTSNYQTGSYRNRIDANIDDYCKKALEQVRKTYGDYAHDSLEIVMSILARGGKRMRGSLAMATYNMFGGKDEAMIIQAARALEMVHAYLLVIDDIADRSPLRRGGPTAHLLFEKYYDDHHLHGDKVHFGQAMGMTAGLLGVHMAELTIDDMEIEPQKWAKAFKSLHQNLVHTIFGQLRDALEEMRDDVTEHDAMAVAKLKTAHYSFVNPMQFGAILAGASDKDLDTLTKFGLEAGVAFQVVDDIQGVFGSEKELGKSVSSDISEGKMTILTTYALAHGSSQDQATLRGALGNQQLSNELLEQAREILKNTSALAHAQETATVYLGRARKMLDEMPESWSGAGREYLNDVLQLIEKQITIRS